MEERRYESVILWPIDAKYEVAMSRYNVLIGADDQAHFRRQASPVRIVSNNNYDFFWSTTTLVGRLAA